MHARVSYVVRSTFVVVGCGVGGRSTNNFWCLLLVGCTLSRLLSVCLSLIAASLCSSLLCVAGWRLTTYWFNCPDSELLAFSI